jgi:CubicO group peptidase (beta-lactamase class C family)
LRNAAEYAECFHGTAANPRYGLCWWLAPPGAPPDVFYASGSGGQAMYVAPSADVVAVRFGNGGSFNHEAFLKRLFGA